MGQEWKNSEIARWYFRTGHNSPWHDAGHFSIEDYVRKTLKRPNPGEILVISQYEVMCHAITKHGIPFFMHYKRMIK